MKPAWTGWEDGQRAVETLPDGSEEIWEWRFEQRTPLFDVTSDAGHHVQGLPRARAAECSRLLFLDPRVSQVVIYPTNLPCAGDWHLVERIAPTPSLVENPS